MKPVSSPQSPECDHPITEKGEPRFFIDHGMIHDRLTGKHVTTEPDSQFCDGIEHACELMNALAERRETKPLKLLFSNDWLREKIATDPDIETDNKELAPPAHQENSPRSAGEPITTEQLDQLQFGRKLHARPAPEPAPQVREALEEAPRPWSFEEGGDGMLPCIGDADGNILMQIHLDPYESPRIEQKIAAMKTAVQIVNALPHDEAVLAALTPVVAREPVGWRVDGTQNGKPAVFFYWKPEWPKMHAEQGDKVTPLYTSPPPASAIREALERADEADWEWLLLRLDRSARGANWRDILIAVRTLSIKGTADESTKSSEIGT